MEYASEMQKIKQTSKNVGKQNGPSLLVTLKHVCAMSEYSASVFAPAPFLHESEDANQKEWRLHMNFNMENCFN